jgi:hypothetical protein
MNKFAARAVVIIFILLCLEVGLVLTLLPWVSRPMFGEWGDNYLLVWITQATGFYGLQQFVASGWVRGAVTGLGILNLFIAFWEMANFSQNVNALVGRGNPIKHENTSVSHSLSDN